jgi:hypothetical protein
MMGWGIYASEKYQDAWKVYPSFIPGKNQIVSKKIYHTSVKISYRSLQF